MILKAVPEPTGPQGKIPEGVAMWERWDFITGKMGFGVWVWVWDGDWGQPTMKVRVADWAPLGFVGLMVLVFLRFSLFSEGAWGSFLGKVR